MIFRTVLLVFCVFYGVCADDTGYFWHVTDLHYDFSYWTKHLSCHNETDGKHGVYGDYWCDSPWKLVEDSIVSMAKLKSDVDFIIWTGDSIPHVSDADLSLDINLGIITNITSVITSNFPNTSVFASLGNHDFHPSGQANYTSGGLYNDVAKIWEEWITNQSEIVTFEEGGYYLAEVKVAPKFKVIALNTNLYYTANKLTANVRDPAGQKAWLEVQLEAARSRGDKVIVTGHVPPAPNTPGLSESFYLQHQKPFVNILLNYSDVIAATHFGHDHSDGFKIMQDEAGKRGVTQFTAPSVTPWRGAPKASAPPSDPHNPGIRLVQYNRITGAQLNYEQYYINLTDSNNNNKTSWGKLYSFKDAYQVPDLSVASLRKIFSNMESNKTAEFSDKYCTYSKVSNYNKICSHSNRADIYCGGLHYLVAEAQACKKNYLDSLNSCSLMYLSSYVVTIAFVIGLFV